MWASWSSNCRTGANSITGQCNAMGSRLFSNTTNLLGGHDFTKEADRAKVAGVQFGNMSLRLALEDEQVTEAFGDVARKVVYRCI